MRLTCCWKEYRFTKLLKDLRGDHRQRQESIIPSLSTLSRLCAEWKGWFRLCIMQERAVECRVAYRFLGCQKGPCSHVQLSLFTLVRFMQASFSDSHKPNATCTAWWSSHFELFHAKDVNGACVLHVTVCWHHTDCWQWLNTEFLKQKALRTFSVFVISIIKSPAAGGWNSLVSRHVWLFFLAWDCGKGEWF